MQPQGMQVHCQQTFMYRMQIMQVCTPSRYTFFQMLAIVLFIMALG